jgi:TonB-linked SusC/RagA family outer membrane protein
MQTPGDFFSITMRNREFWRQDAEQFFERHLQQREWIMFKSIRNVLFVLALLAVLPGLVFAQTGTISGKVVDSRTGDGLPGASVIVEGLDIGAATNTDGEYSITNVPVGARRVLARFIGYKSSVQTVNVSGGSVVELNYELNETVLQLDEVVVTGAGVASEKRKLGNTVVTINASSLEDAPVGDLSEVLTGREAGVSVLPSNGIVGTGARIRIRGVASLAQSNEPIVYIDGIRVNNGAGFTLNGAGGASRLDDINPNAIERIEILKGAAAATLYGTQASNGIIQIFTKKGSFSKPRFNLEIRQTAISYPDRYHPNAGFARTEAQAQTMSDVFGFPVRPYELVTRTSVKDLFDTGYGQTYSLSVSGGGSGVTYFASGRFQQADGPLNPQPEDFAVASLPGETFEPGGANDFFRRAQFTANVNLIPTNKLSVRLGTGYSNIHNEMPSNGNNIFGLVSLAMFGKPERVAENNPQGQRAFMTTRESTYREQKEDTEHAYVSMTANYKLTNDIGLEGTFGLDFTGERSSNFRPFAYDVDNFTGNVPDGALDLLKREKKEWTLDVKANWNRNLTNDISSSLVAGFQGFKTEVNFSEGYGERFPGPGLEVLDATDAPTQQTFSSFVQVINAGWFFQEQIGYKDYLYVTGGLRFDANSAFGTNFSTQSYPKLSISFVPSSAFPGLAGSFLSTLRVRGAVGRSGQQPNAFDNLTTYGPFSSAEGPGVSPGNLGNPDLKPEVSTEYEAGFEAGMLNDRLGFEFTYWDRTITDALVNRQFAYSGGFRSPQLDNIGEIAAKGVDLNVRFAALKGENFTLDVFANGAYLNEEVIDLGGSPALKAGGSYPRYRNYVWPGFAPGAHLGAELNRSLEYPIDLDGDNVAESKEELLAFFAEPRFLNEFGPVLIEAEIVDPVSGEIIKDFLLNYLGKPTPDWSGSFGFNVGFMKHFRLATLFEYKAGNYFVNNLTDAFRKSNPLIGRNMPESAAIELAVENPTSTAEQRLEAANNWVREFLALRPYSGLNTIEKADFIRWRELSIAYDVPRRIVSTFGLRNATITLAGRNIAMFTGYSGIDQEMNALGRRSGGGTNTNFLTGVDAFGYPIPRQFSFSLKVGF